MATFPEWYGVTLQKVLLYFGTDVNSFQENWILELGLALDPNLHFGSPNHELSFELSFELFFSWSEAWTNWFSLQNGAV